MTLLLALTLFFTSITGKKNCILFFYFYSILFQIQNPSLQGGRLPALGEQTSFLNVMHSRYILRTGLAKLITGALKAGRGKVNINESMSALPDAVAQIFMHPLLAPNIRYALKQKKVPVIDPPRIRSVDTTLDLMIVDIPRCAIIADLFGTEYYRFPILDMHYVGDVGSHNTWRTAYFATIDPNSAHGKFTLSYDSNTNILYVNASVQKRSYMQSHLDFAIELDDWKRKLQGKRFYDVKMGDWFWILNVIDDSTSYRLRGNNKRSRAYFICKCVSETSKGFTKFDKIHSPLQMSSSSITIVFTAA